MRTRLLNLSLLAALALAVSRLWLFLDAPTPTLPVSRGVTAPTAATPEVRDTATEGTPLGPEEYDVIVARDLFSPTRGVVPPAPVAPVKPPPKPLPAPKLTLSGVVILEGRKAAYLQEGSQDARPQKVLENGAFAGGVVKTIKSDGIIFLFAGSEVTVPLRTPKEGATAPAPRSNQVPGVLPQRSEPPAAFPRRLAPGTVPQGRMRPPGDPTSVGQGVPSLPPGMPGAPGGPSAPSPVEPGVEAFGDEEFPEMPLPGEDAPVMTDDEGKD